MPCCRMQSCYHWSQDCTTAACCLHSCPFPQTIRKSQCMHAMARSLQTTTCMYRHTAQLFMPIHHHELSKQAHKAPHALFGDILHSTCTTSISVVYLSLQVCIVLRMMAEEVTQYRDDLEADNKRQLLSALTACVPQVLPFLEQSMEGHFGQAMAAAQQGQHLMSQLHAAVVTAALGKPHPPPLPLSSLSSTPAKQIFCSRRSL